MPEPTRETGPPPEPADDQLNSWKEIAAYFSRDVTTVQRWEKREGMPVHRHLHDKMGSVYAFRAELAVWARSRNAKAEEESAAAFAAPDPVRLPETVKRADSRRRPSPFLRPLAAAAAMVILAIGAVLLLRRTDYLWRNPIDGARFQTITDFDGITRDAAISRDGQLVAFLSDHDGPMDVWVSQIGSGQFHNLTHGSAGQVVNPFVRTLGFSADSSLVTFWVRKQDGSKNNGISIWAVPTLGGQPRPYLQGAAEFDWSPEGTQLAYHTPGPGDPLIVSDSTKQPGSQPIFTAPAGLHSHFPVWSRDARFIYFVQGTLPDKLDVWRVGVKGGTAERITTHSGNVSYPVLLNRETLLYLAADRDGSGPWLYGMNLARRTPHRLTTGPEHYTSLAASADGRRIVATLATPKRTLWRLVIDEHPTTTSPPSLIALTTSAGFSPRFGPNYLLYVSSTGRGDSIWKMSDGIETELWSAQGSQIIAAPVVSDDGASIAFPVRLDGQSRMYTMQSDGTNIRAMAGSLDLQGTPAWGHDGQLLTSAVNSAGVPQLIGLSAGRTSAVPFLKEYSMDPVWAPDGRFVVYSGADIGTTFPIKAARPDGTPYHMPKVTLTRGSRHLVFAFGGHSLVHLRGEMQHKDLWALDLQTGAERQLTKVPPDFDIRDFDVSRDGHEVVLERVQERSDIVLMEVSAQ